MDIDIAVIVAVVINIAVLFADVVLEEVMLL